MKHRLPRKIKKQIPQNTPYCYGGSRSDKYCKLLFRNKFGYNDCRYLVKTYGKFNGEDDDDFDFCLDDACKGCRFGRGKCK